MATKQPDQDPVVDEEDDDEEEVPEIDAAEGDVEQAEDEPVVDTIRWAAENGFDPRTSLPVPHMNTPNDGLLSILKKNMGKKLSNISMPVTLNEPLSSLQRLCEELEYSILLDQAAFAETSDERLMLVAAFAISSYAPTYYRSGRKPFNPILGETFDCVRPERGFRFVAEQVSHHPPISVCFAESQHWTFFQEASAKTRTRPSSLRITPQGYVRVHFSLTNETYEWRKVNTSVEDVMSGKNKWVDHFGTMEIRNLLNGDFCKVEFQQHSVFKKSRKHDVTGSVYRHSDAKKPVLEFKGKWHENLVCKQTKQEIWKADAPSQAAIQTQFGFTPMALELNELPPEGSALRDTMLETDSRFRTDQRMYENAELDKAQQEKLRVEELQRQQRQKNIDAGTPWRPRFFDYRRTLVTSPHVQIPAKSPRTRRKSSSSPDAGKVYRDVWEYKGGFWKAKKEKSIPPCHELW